MTMLVSLVPSKLPQSFPERVLEIRDSGARPEIADLAKLISLLLGMYR